MEFKARLLGFSLYLAMSPCEQFKTFPISGFPLFILGNNSIYFIRPWSELKKKVFLSCL